MRKLHHVALPAESILCVKSVKIQSCPNFHKMSPPPGPSKGPVFFISQRWQITLYFIPSIYDHIRHAQEVIAKPARAIFFLLLGWFSPPFPFLDSQFRSQAVPIARTVCHATRTPLHGDGHLHAEWGEAKMVHFSPPIWYFHHLPLPCLNFSSLPPCTHHYHPQHTTTTPFLFL